MVCPMSSRRPGPHLEARPRTVMVARHTPTILATFWRLTALCNNQGPSIFSWMRGLG